MTLATLGPRAVFLDRDGVLNTVKIQEGLPRSPDTLDELRVYPDVYMSLERLKQAGFVLVMATNQPNVSRGIQTRQVVDAMNERLAELLPLDEVRVCYHDDTDGCTCRKPLPGLLTAAPYYNLARSVMIGDRWRDVEAGRSAGCKTVFIDRGYAERRPTADVRVSSITQAADWILSTIDAR